MHAGLDSLVTLLIFVGIAIISTLLKKKTPVEDDASHLPPMGSRVPPPPTRPRQKTWEDELRDLLQQQNPPAPPLPQQRPARRPPVVVPAPPPLPAGAEEISLAVPQPRVEPHFQALRGLSESQQRYSQAATLDQRVAQHLQETTHRPVGLTSVQRRASEAGGDARAMLRDRRTLRAAILASVVLGPPRALE